VAAVKKNTRTPVNKRKKPYNEKHIIGFFFCICLFLSLFLGSLLFALDQLKIPDIRTVSHYRPPQTTLIFDRHGTIIDRLYSENRIVIPLDRMNPLLPKAFVAAEDGRFFEHPGLDSFSVLRALMANLREGRKSQGGSTITQQVAKGLLLSPEKTYLRKFKEAILAWRIDSLLSKDDIIYIYLNQIYLGDGAYGVEAASLNYFNKHASELNLGEIALLAGLPQAPSRYSPSDHWDRAHARQRYVLNRMAADGYISEEQARSAYTRRIQLTSRDNSAAKVNGYYLQEVRRRAEQMIGSSLETAGIRIYTNLDQKLQRQADLAVREGVKALAKRHPQQYRAPGSIPEAALICIEGCSGKIRALTGGTDFLKTPFNRAVQAKRPAGSVFKPLVYSSAFELGWTPDSIIIDEPISIGGSGGKPWQPKNFSGTFYGKTSLGNALVHSYNIPPIKLLQKIGVKPVHKRARDFGISSPLPPDLSLALGAADVSLLEMSAAYQPFTCGGNYQQPVLIDKITRSDGTELYRHRLQSQKVLTAHAAAETKRLLTRVISEGTGRRAKGLPGVSGGKTGTSDENRDAWFIGFNRGLLVGVWVGNDRNESLGTGESGGRTAAPIWRFFMQEAIE